MALLGRQVRGEASSANCLYGQEPSTYSLGNGDGQWPTPGHIRRFLMTCLAVRSDAVALSLITADERGAGARVPRAALPSARSAEPAASSGQAAAGSCDRTSARRFSDRPARPTRTPAGAC